MWLSINSQHRKKPTLLLLSPCKCTLQVPLLARAQGWHMLMFVLPLQPGEARGQKQHHHHHMDTVSCVYLSAFTWYLVASVFSFWVTPSEPFSVKAPHTPSEKHLLNSTNTCTEINFFSILSPLTGCYQQPHPANNCPDHAPRNCCGSNRRAPQCALTPAALKVLQDFGVHFVGVPGFPSCWTYHFVSATVKTSSGLIYPALQLIWTMLWTFDKAGPVLISRCFLRKQDHK